MHYYNEFDTAAAETIRNLIELDLVPRGRVDERDIRDVTKNDLEGFIQCHFFAGIAGWPHALQLAGVDPARPLWTASAPCQPFSAAGAAAGFADERHLWPDLHWLIGECRPVCVLGEQVASPRADPWIDLVHADLEGLGYTFGCVPAPSAGFGAPHIRERNYWVAHASGAEHQGRAEQSRGDSGATLDTESAAGQQRLRAFAFAGGAGAHGMADPDHARPQGRLQHGGGRAGQCAAGPHGVAGGLANADSESGGRRGIQGSRESAGEGEGAARERSAGFCEAYRDGGPRKTHGFWAAVDWLLCRDDKWRPVEPGTFPLAHGFPASLGRGDSRIQELAKLAGLDAKSLREARSYRIAALRGYGNAINPHHAAHFIRAALDL